MIYNNIAILMTCFNRRELTLSSIKSLYEQELPPNLFFDIYLVDDDSTDGTSDTLKQFFPNVKIIKGNGNLFWCGGMRLAWEEAAKGNYDGFLWLNDDTILLPQAIYNILNTTITINNKTSKDAIIIGSCLDQTTGVQSYGGRLLKNNKLITPLDYPQECEMINGNIVFVPKKIFAEIGNLSADFKHSSGDNDYGLRALKKGFKLWIAPNYLGYCTFNKEAKGWANPQIPLRQRLNILNSPKGQPFYETFIFAKRHKGLLWPLDLINLYLLVLFPKSFKNIKEKIKTTFKHID